MSRVGLAFRLAALAGAFLVLAPVQWAIIRKGSARAGALPLVLHRLFLKLFGIRVTVLGTPPAPGAATLVLANHVSWLDIPVMGSAVPLSFVAKQEIAGWPLFGLCARLQGCVFLDRTRKAATAEVNREVADRLNRGETIVLFPEGTTGDGNRLLPFRSSIVGAARAALSASSPDDVRLQPLAIAYTGRAGLPVTRRERPEIAWYGDMDLPPHLVGFTKAGPLDIVLTWCDPLPAGMAEDRKRATLAAEHAVRSALQNLSRRTADAPRRA